MHIGLYFMCPLENALHIYKYRWSVPSKVKGNLSYLDVVVEVEEKPRLT
jgi:hypothetical protein